MKTAISIPDDVFAGAERLARRAKKSRSQLYSDAIKEYIARHAPDQVTDTMNQVCGTLDTSPDEFVSSSAASLLKKAVW